MKSAAFSCAAPSTPSAIHASMRSSIAGSSARSSRSARGLAAKSPHSLGMIRRRASARRYSRYPSRPSPVNRLNPAGSRAMAGNTIRRAAIWSVSLAQRSASSTADRRSGSGGNSGGSGRRSSRKRAIRWFVEIRSRSAASAGTVARRSPTRSPKVGRPPAVRVCPPASNPCSQATMGCRSVTTSTRRYGTCLCSSMSIAERQACDPGIT